MHRLRITHGVKKCEKQETFKFARADSGDMAMCSGRESGSAVRNAKRM